MQKCVEIAGPDAEAFMQLLTPRDITTIEPGRCAYVFLTNQDGGVLNDPVMLRIAEDRFWLSTADSDMYLWAKGVSAFSGHEVEIATPHVYPMQLQGPRSAEIMVDVFGEEILDLRYYWWMRSSVDGIDVVISRPATAPNSATRCISSAKRGRTLGDPDDGRPAVWHLARLTQPHPPHRRRRTRLCVRHHPDENPLELGLDRLIADTDFLGKAALEKVRDEGVRRRLVGLFLDGPALQKNNEHRWPVTSASTKVGFVTNAVHSPALIATSPSP